MVRRMRVAAFVALAALWTLPVHAIVTKPGKPSVPVQVIDGVFANEKGETTRFQITPGGVVKIKNAKLNLSYKLHAGVLVDGKVELRLQQFFDQEQTGLMGEEVIQSRLDGQFQKSSGAPFSVALTGTSTRQAKVKIHQRAKLAVEDDGGDNFIACCVSCGDWTICCGVELGYDYDWICCTIYSCIECTVCEIWVD